MEYRLKGFTQSQRRLELFNYYLITESAHTPKPEKMFEKLHQEKIAYVKRRPFKPPVLVFLKDV